MADTIWGFPAAQVTTFDNAYKASFDPRIQALWGVADFDARKAEALALAQEGLLIDVPIMVYLCDPFVTQFLRKQYGLFWTPSGLQTPLSNASFGGPYSVASPQPVGALKVSIDPADYPAFVPPPPVPVPPPLPVATPGNDLGFKINGYEVFSSSAQQHYVEGTETPDQQYSYHLLGNPLTSPLERVGVWLYIGGGQSA
jgi:hypothetical protein